MRVPFRFLIVAASFGLATAASAQKSLFDQPAVNEPSATSAAPATATTPAAKPKPRPKPRGPVPARALQVSNDSTVTVSALVVSGDGKSAKLAKPLAPGGKVTLKLPAFKTCMATVTATRDETAEPETSEHDICKDKSVRLTD